MSEEKINELEEAASLFKIDNAYTITKKEVPTTFLSGFITKGTLHAGEGIVVYNENAEPVLTCKILEIERIGRDSLAEITYVEDGGNENAYGLWVDNDQIELFKEGYFITSLVNGKNKTNKDRISPERLEELKSFIADNASIESLRFLSTQELSAILKNLLAMNDSAKAGFTTAVKELIYDKLINAEVLYLTIDTATKMPFLNNGLPDIYSLKSFAEDAIDYYSKQFRELELMEVKKDETPLAIMLTLLGAKNFTLDNGQHHVTLEVNQLLTEEDKKNSLIELSNEHPPFFTPEFRFAMDMALSELRWTVNYPERQENCKRKDDEMWEAFKKSNLLLTIQKEENTTDLPDGQIAIPHINNGNGDEFIAVFTDLREVEKLYKLDDWGIMLMSPEKILTLDDNVGLVINPLTENLVIPKDKLAEFRVKILGENATNTEN